MRLEVSENPFSASMMSHCSGCCGARDLSEMPGPSRILPCRPAARSIDLHRTVDCTHKDEPDTASLACRPHRSPLSQHKQHQKQENAKGSARSRTHANVSRCKIVLRIRSRTHDTTYVSNQKNMHCPARRTRTAARWPPSSARKPRSSSTCTSRAPYRVPDASASSQKQVLSKRRVTAPCGRCCRPLLEKVGLRYAVFESAE